MISKVVFAGLCFFFVCQAMFLDNIHLMNACQNNTDCPGGCCHQDRVGNRCHNYSMESHPCHLPNHKVNVMLYPCGCAAGLTCQEIHFTPDMHVVGANGSDPIGQVEQLLLTHGYGLCKA